MPNVQEKKNFPLLAKGCFDKYCCQEKKKSFGCKSGGARQVFSKTLLKKKKSLKLFLAHDTQHPVFLGSMPSTSFQGPSADSGLADLLKH